MFEDRQDAARQLAARLRDLRLESPLVLGIPRGGVPMARAVADALGGELDVVLVHKIGSPGNPEYAIGAVGEDGRIHVREPDAWDIDRDYIEREAARQVRTLHERRAQYTPVRPPIDPTGRDVVIVDDGSATGATMLAALSVVAEARPKRLVAALAVAPPSVVEKLRTLATDVVCLESPALFFAVGQFYHVFEQVSDDAVIDCLEHSSHIL